MKHRILNDQYQYYYYYCYGKKEKKIYLLIGKNVFLITKIVRRQIMTGIQFSQTPSHKSEIFSKRSDYQLCNS